MRLIDADALKDRICEDKFWNWGYAACMVNDSPTIDSVTHGQWKERVIEYDTGYKAAMCECSVCGKNIPLRKVYADIGYPYCFRCGAKMEEVVKCD